MITVSEVSETNKMILEENLDVRTITMGVSLLDCADASLARTCGNVYAKLVRLAGRLVKTGDEIGREFGVPIVNKRIAVTPVALVGAASQARRAARRLSARPAAGSQPTSCASRRRSTARRKGSASTS